MRRLNYILIGLLLGSVSSVLYAQPAPIGEHAVTKTFKIGGDGRWDYLTFNPENHLLYVTRTTHVQVINPATGKVVGDIGTGQGLHGSAIVPSVGRGFITDGEVGNVIMFDLKTNRMLGTIPAADDADGIIYDAGTDRVLISCGDAKKLVVLDPNADLKSAKVQSVDLDGKPEFLAADGKGKAFVCINDKNMIAAVDLKTLKVTDRWPCGTATAPTGLAIDAEHGRLFVGCRSQKLVIMSTADGKVEAELPIGPSNDACIFDPGTGTAFASCGDQTTTLVRETSAGKFEIVQTLKTAQGARTMALDPMTHTLYLPTADYASVTGGRPVPTAGSFKVIVAEPGTR